MTETYGATGATGPEERSPVPPPTVGGATGASGPASRSATPENPSGEILQGPRIEGAWSPDPFIARKVSDGLSVRVICPDGHISRQGEFHYYNGFFGFNLTRPKMDPEGDVAIILQIEQGEYETNQVAAAATFDLGAAVYFTPGNGTTPGVLGQSGTHYVGIVTVAKDASGAIWMHLAAQQAPAA